MLDGVGRNVYCANVVAVDHTCILYDEGERDAPVEADAPKTPL